MEKSNERDEKNGLKKKKRKRKKQSQTKAKGKGKRNIEWIEFAELKTESVMPSSDAEDVQLCIEHDAGVQFVCSPLNMLGQVAFFCLEITIIASLALAERIYGLGVSVCLCEF